MMKKASKLIAMAFLFIICLGMIPMKAFAASPDDILTVSASGTSVLVTVSGTADTGVVAVAIEIFDATNAIVAMETFPVTAGSYTATLTTSLTPGDSYTAYVVNYNGLGDPKETTFTATAPPTPPAPPTPQAPPTPPAPPTPAGDAGSASNSTPTPQVAPTAEVEPVVPVAETPVQTVSPKTNDGMGTLVALAVVVLIAYAGYFVKRRA